MELSFAPMEGVTNGPYRAVHAAFFPGADLYYAPFLAPDSEGRVKASALQELSAAEPRPVPQLLVNRAEPFLLAARQLFDLGFAEINLNAGCPSGTVVAKHKGAGMLADLDSLARCLDEIFARCPARVSIKTRLGLEDASAFPALLALYRRYPLARLIVHVRDRKGLYRSRPDLAAFAEALEGSPFPVVYNGDIFSPADAEKLRARFPAAQGLMLGRGAVCNPALFRRIRGGEALRREELRAFHDALVEAALESGLAPHYAAARMKELWYYMRCLFPGSERALKAVFKAKSLPDYEAAVSALFSGAAFDPDAVFTQP